MNLAAYPGEPPGAHPFIQREETRTTFIIATLSRLFACQPIPTRLPTPGPGRPTPA